jgi:hypothetical protein
MVIFQKLNDLKDHGEALGYYRFEVNFYLEPRPNYGSEVRFAVEYRATESDSTEYRYFSKDKFEDTDLAFEEAREFVLNMPSLDEHRRQDAVRRSEAYEERILEDAAHEDDAVLKQHLLDKAAREAIDRKQLLGLFYKQGYHITAQ